MNLELKNHFLVFCLIFHDWIAPKIAVFNFKKLKRYGTIEKYLKWFIQN
jgi:hypothetical protein